MCSDKVGLQGRPAVSEVESIMAPKARPGQTVAARERAPHLRPEKAVLEARKRTQEGGRREPDWWAALGSNQRPSA